MTREKMISIIAAEIPAEGNVDPIVIAKAIIRTVETSGMKIVAREPTDAMLKQIAPEDSDAPFARADRSRAEWDWSRLFDAAPTWTQEPNR